MNFTSFLLRALITAFFYSAFKNLSFFTLKRWDCEGRRFLGSTDSFYWGFSSFSEGGSSIFSYLSPLFSGFRSNTLFCMLAKQSFSIKNSFIFFSSSPFPSPSGLSPLLAKALMAFYLRISCSVWAFQSIKWCQNPFS